MEVKRNGAFWRFAYMASLLLVLAIPIIFIILNTQLIPPSKTALFNRNGGLFQDEDLSKTSVSEGMVKQFIVTAFEETFDFNFLSLVAQDDYQSIVEEKKEQDLPDHRDVIRPFFSAEAHEKVKQLLLDGPWMSNIYRHRGYVIPVTSQPPIRQNTRGWDKNAKGYLTAGYDGSVVAVVVLPGADEVRRFRIAYTVHVTRKPLLLQQPQNAYYFSPLVRRNVGEWHISDVSWTVDRVM